MLAQMMKVYCTHLLEYCNASHEFFMLHRQHTIIKGDLHDDSAVIRADAIKRWLQKPVSSLILILYDTLFQTFPAIGQQKQLTKN